MPRFLRAICFAITVLVGFSAAAEDRLALVIGNAGYQNVPSLANPVNDAQLMERTLREAGFRVTTVVEADREQMTRAIERFGQEVRAAEPGALALFYFAGHGVRSDGFNYLVPLNVNIRAESDFSRETLAAEWVLDQIQAPGVTSVMVLDACRNNPFDGSGTLPELGDGLARMTATDGNFIAYATGPGDIALDGVGDNSPYTAALARAIQAPDLDVHAIFTQVREDVVAATDGAQIPWETSSLNAAVYIQPGLSGSAVTDTPVIRLSVAFNTEGWNVGFKCRKVYTYEPVSLAAARGRTHRIRPTNADQGIALDLDASGGAAGEELRIAPAPDSDSGRPVVVKLNKLAAGSRRAFYTNLEHPDMADCGTMTVNVRRDQ